MVEFNHDTEDRHHRAQKLPKKLTKKAGGLSACLHPKNDLPHHQDRKPGNIKKNGEQGA